MNWQFNESVWSAHRAPFTFWVFIEADGAFAFMRYADTTKREYYETVDEAKLACLLYAQVETQGQMDYFSSF